MNLSQLKQEVRNILRERSVKAIQKEYSSVVDDIQKHLELYKKSKGTAEEKKHIGHLKTLGEKKKSLQKELDRAVAGLYKNAELKVDEAITNPKKSNPSDLAKIVIGWYDFNTDYIDDGGQRRRAIKSNEDVVNWFNSHPLDVKQKAFKVMLSTQPSLKSNIQRIFSSSLKESVNEAKTYKKGDKLKIKLPNGKKFDVVFDSYLKQKGVALGKFKDSHGEYDIKPFNLDTIVESVNEATEPQLITKLRDIVKNQQYQTLKDPKSGKSMKVDMQTANVIVKVYDALKDPKNKEKFYNSGLLGMQTTAFKLMK